MFQNFPDDIDYNVVINHEEQYSIWPANRKNRRRFGRTRRQGFTRTRGPTRIDRAAEPNRVDRSGR